MGMGWDPIWLRVFNSKAFEWPYTVTGSPNSSTGPVTVTVIPTVTVRPFN